MLSVGLEDAWLKCDKFRLLDTLLVQLESAMQRVAIFLRLSDGLYPLLLRGLGAILASECLRNACIVQWRDHRLLDDFLGPSERQLHRELSLDAEIVQTERFSLRAAHVELRLQDVMAVANSCIVR